jgi:hypothetical protein
MALADGRCDDDGFVTVDPAFMECPEPGSNRHNPWTAEDISHD